MSKSKILVVVTALAMVTAVVLPAAATPGRSGDRIDVVVVLGSGHPSEVARDHDVQVSQVYRHALNGLAGSVPTARLNGLRHDPRVASVEQDVVVTTAAQMVPTGIERSFAASNANLGIDGIDDQRIDVDVAVLDTGVDSSHPDLNVVRETNCARRGPTNTTCVDGSASDGDGHGTHVAGTIAALDNDLGVVGVAPGARIHAVKVLGDNGSGYLSWIIAGIDWVTSHAAEIEVANMSLGFQGTSTAIDTAIGNSIAAGVTYVVAAGNSDSDAKGFSPANSPGVIAVSALADFNGVPGGGGAPTCRADQDDTLADFSNWGSTVDIAAPGVCIRSTVPGGGYDTYSGTSMASPHVAGAAALLLATQERSPAQVASTLRAEGNFDWTDDSGDGTKEPLLDVSDPNVFDPTTVPVVGGGDDGGDGGGGDTSCPPGQHRKGLC